MLEPLLGSTNCERVLLFLNYRKEGYAREIARHFDTDLAPIQKQLDKLEFGGVLVSRKIGRTRLFEFSPRYPFRSELQALIEKAFQFYSNEDCKKLIMNRRRPRRMGKPFNT